MQRLNESRIKSIDDIVHAYNEVAVEYEAKAKSDEEQSFLSLFRYIRKNRILLDKLGISYHSADNSFSTYQSAFQKDHEEQISNFYQQIQEGDLSDDVFKNPEGLTYCLILLKENKITFNQAMTVYSFMLAQGQFAENKNERAIEVVDKDRIGSIGLKPVNLVNGNVLSKYGKNYIDYIRFSVIPDIDKEAMEKFILNLPASEQWFSVLVYSHEDYQNYKYSDSRPTELLIDVLSSNQDRGLFLRGEREDSYVMLVPSFSLIQYLLKAISPNHMRMRFGFGRVTEKTLYASHQQNDHFIPLYHPDVKSNMVEAHNFTCGPYVVLLHDVSHTVWASHLSLQERLFILNDLLPVVSGLNDHLYFKNIYRQSALKMAMTRLNDFEMLGFEERTLEYYLDRMIFSLIDRDFIETKEEFGNFPLVLGVTLADRLYLFIGDLLKESDFDDAVRTILMFICDQIYPEIDDVLQDDNRKIIDDIRRTAMLKDYQSLPLYSKKQLKNIDWQAWWEILHLYSMNPGVIWRAITTNKARYNEYLLLCRHAGLKFIYPYLPFTKNHFNDFKIFIRDGQTASAKSQPGIEMKKEPVSQKRKLPGFFERDVEQGLSRPQKRLKPTQNKKENKQSEKKRKPK